jgi:hypothetical protein
MARRLDAARAPGCRPPRRASTLAHPEETRDRHGRLIGTMRALPLLPRAQQLHHIPHLRPARPPTMHPTQKAHVRGRPTTLVQQESERPCSRVSADPPASATRRQVSQDLLMLARILTLVGGSSATPTADIPPSLSHTCMQTRAMRNQSQRFWEEPANIEIHHHQSRRSHLHLLQLGTRAGSEHRQARRATAHQRLRQTTSRAGVKKAST